MDYRRWATKDRLWEWGMDYRRYAKRVGFFDMDFENRLKRHDNKTPN